MLVYRGKLPTSSMYIKSMKYISLRCLEYYKCCIITCHTPEKRKQALYITSVSNASGSAPIVFHGKTMQPIWTHFFSLCFIKNKNVLQNAF